MAAGHQKVTLAWIRRGVQADVEEFVRRAYPSDAGCDKSTVLRKLGVMLMPPVLCSAAYRTSHWLHSHAFKRMAHLVGWLNFLVHRADLAPASEIGPGLYIPHTAGVVFHGRAGSHLTLYCRSAAIGARLDPRPDQVGDDCPHLGNHVTLGAFSIVKGPVTIGNHTLVGASSVVAHDLPANLMALRRVRGHAQR
jgi:serine O-acetyltransferase